MERRGKHVRWGKMIRAPIHFQTRKAKLSELVYTFCLQKKFTKGAKRSCSTKVLGDFVSFIYSPLSVLRIFKAWGFGKKKFKADQWRVERVSLLYRRKVELYGGGGGINEGTGEPGRTAGQVDAVCSLERYVVHQFQDNPSPPTEQNIYTDCTYRSASWAPCCCCCCCCNHHFSKFTFRRSLNIPSNLSSSSTDLKKTF